MEFGYSEIVTIKTHEVDRDKKITVPALLMLMQEASMQNVLELKASVWDMADMEISWVLLRKELVVFRRAILGERLKVITYPAGFDRVFAYRDFLVYDDNDRLVASAGSTWTLINTSTRKMERIPKVFYEFNPSKIAKFLNRPKSKIKRLEESRYSKKYEVSFFDLDWNGHVNNNVLSKLILQTVPDNYLFEKELEFMTIHIKAECFFREILKIQTDAIDSDSTRHQIINSEDGRIIALAECGWK